MRFIFMHKTEPRWEAGALPELIATREKGQGRRDKREALTIAAAPLRMATRRPRAVPGRRSAVAAARTGSTRPPPALSTHRKPSDVRYDATRGSVGHPPEISRIETTSSVGRGVPGPVRPTTPTRLPWNDRNSSWSPFVSV